MFIRFNVQSMVDKNNISNKRTAHTTVKFIRKIRRMMSWIQIGSFQGWIDIVYFWKIELLELFYSLRGTVEYRMQLF